MTQKPRSHHTRTSIPKTPVEAYGYCYECKAMEGKPCQRPDGTVKMLCSSRTLGPRYNYRVQS